MTRPASLIFCLIESYHPTGAIVGILVCLIFLLEGGVLLLPAARRPLMVFGFTIVAYLLLFVSCCIMFPVNAKEKRLFYFASGVPFAVFANIAGSCTRKERS